MTTEQFCRALSETRPEFLEECENMMKKRTGTLSRAMLLAAVIVLLGCVSALAVGLSLRQSARNDMGIQSDRPIPEWTEYEKTKGNKVELMSTLCSGGHVIAYLEVKDISPEDGLALENGTISWGFGGVSTYGYNCSLIIDHVEYDAENRTALVKVRVFGELLENVNEITLDLALERSVEQREFFTPVVIPITGSQVKAVSVELPVLNADLGLEGSVTQVSVTASNMAVTLQLQPSRQWMAENGYEANGTDGLHRYFESWFNAADTYLQNARIGFADGSSMAVTDIPGPFAANWIVENSELDPLETEGRLTLQHVFRQAIDLSTVTSVTIGGSTFVLQ